MNELFFPVKFFYIASTFYFIGFLFYIFRLTKISIIFLLIGFSANLTSEIFGRYITWPFCNMFSEVFFLPLSLCVIILILIKLGKKEGLHLYFLIVTFCFIALFLSEGYYPPFTLMSKSIYAHLFHLFLFIAHSLLISSGFMAILSLLKLHQSVSTKLMLWGYAVLSIAGLFGMIWSYMGRGDVISWNHYFFHSIGIWVYYTAVLHVHLIKGWNETKRSWLLIGGVILILWLDILPQLGSFSSLRLIRGNIYESF